MGNILSFFFPQPEPPSIEQVEEVVEEKTIEQEIKDADVVENTKSADLVIEKEIEPDDRIHTDEGFEVVEGATLSEISNTHHNTVTGSGTENNTECKNESSVFTDERDSETPCCDLTLEPEKDEIAIEIVETLKVENTPCMINLTSNSPPDDVDVDVDVIRSIQKDNFKSGRETDERGSETPCCDLTLEPNIDEVEIKMVENALRVESTPCLFGLTSNSPPDDIDMIGSIEDENVKSRKEKMIKEPETVSEAPDEHETVTKSTAKSTMVIPEPVKSASPNLSECVQLQKDTDDEEIIGEPEVCSGLISKKSLLTEVVKEQTPDLTEDLPELITIATDLVKVPCPEVGVIGSLSDEKLKENAMFISSTSGSSVMPSNYEVKEDRLIAEAPAKVLSPEVELPTNVPGGVEGLKDVLTELSFQDYEAKPDSLVTEAPVKAVSLDVDPLKEVSGGVEGLKDLLTESN